MKIMSRLLVALFLLASLRGADPGEIRQAAADVTQALDVQRQLPEDSPLAAPPPPRERERNSGGDAEEVPGQLSAAPGDVWNLLKWTLVGLAIAAVVALLVSWMMESRALHGAPRTRPVAPRTPGSPAPPAAPDQLLALAEEYAAAGRYSEAMHLVLLAATAMLRAPDSLTSWELLKTASLAPAARQALRTLIARVERAWFGKQPAGTEDYQAARASFRDFAAARETA
jgi:hypothetical protein